MELVEFHFSVRLDFTGQSPGWCEVENLPGFSIGEALEYAEEITKKENHCKRKSQNGMVKDREYDSSASALEGKRELNKDETARLKQLWKKLVRMFHPDLHE